jgi:hypothetical protein
MNTTSKIIMMGVLSLCSMDVNAQIFSFTLSSRMCDTVSDGEDMDSVMESLEEVLGVNSHVNGGYTFNIEEELHGYDGLPGTVWVVGATSISSGIHSPDDMTYLEGTYEQCSAIAKVFEYKNVRGEIARHAKAEAESVKEDKLRIEREQVEAARKLTPEYKASEAAGQIRYAKRIIQSANEAIAEEKEIGAISGAMNLNRLHQAGEMIVFNKSVIKSQWGIYKVNGGEARSVDELLAPSNK